MTETPSDELHHGPILLCAGTDPVAAARLAEAAVALLEDRPAVVLATWRPPPVIGGWEAVIDAFYDTDVELRAAARQAAEETAKAAADVLEGHGIHVTRRICPEELSPWQEILGRADEVDATVIVAGVTEAHAVSSGRLGHQARALAHRAHRPVLFVPSAGAPEPPAGAPAIFAYDGSAPAADAIAAAAVLLRRRPAIVAGAWQPVGQAVGVAMVAVPDEVVRTGAERLDERARLEAAGQASDGAQRLSDAGWTVRAEALRTVRNATAAILHEADERNAAVVVTGTRGRSALTAALLGSTAEGILRHAGRPVLLVPPARDAE